MQLNMMTFQTTSAAIKAGGERKETGEEEGASSCTNHHRQQQIYEARRCWNSRRSVLLSPVLLLVLIILLAVMGGMLTILLLSAPFISFLSSPVLGAEATNAFSSASSSSTPTLVETNITYPATYPGPADMVVNNIHFFPSASSPGTAIADPLYTRISTLQATTYTITMENMPDAGSPALSVHVHDCTFGDPARTGFGGNFDTQLAIRGYLPGWSWWTDYGPLSILIENNVFYHSSLKIFQYLRIGTTLTIRNNRFEGLFPDIAAVTMSQIQVDFFLETASVGSPQAQQSGILLLVVANNLTITPATNGAGFASSGNARGISNIYLRPRGAMMNSVLLVDSNDIARIGARANEANLYILTQSIAFTNTSMAVARNRLYLGVVQGPPTWPLGALGNVPRSAAFTAPAMSIATVPGGATAISSASVKIYFLNSDNRLFAGSSIRVRLNNHSLSGYGAATTTSALGGSQPSMACGTIVPGSTIAATGPNAVLSFEYNLCDLSDSPGATAYALGQHQVVLLDGGASGGSGGAQERIFGNLIIPPIFAHPTVRGASAAVQCPYLLGYYNLFGTVSGKGSGLVIAANAILASPSLAAQQGPVTALVTDGDLLGLQASQVVATDTCLVQVSLVSNPGIFDNFDFINGASLNISGNTLLSAGAGRLAVAAAAYRWSMGPLTSSTTSTAAFLASASPASLALALPAGASALLPPSAAADRMSGIILFTTRSIDRAEAFLLALVAGRFIGGGKALVENNHIALGYSTALKDSVAAAFAADAAGAFSTPLVGIAWITSNTFIVSNVSSVTAPSCCSGSSGSSDPAEATAINAQYIAATVGKYLDDVFSVPMFPNSPVSDGAAQQSLLFDGANNAGFPSAQEIAFEGASSSGGGSAASLDTPYIVATSAFFPSSTASSLSASSSWLPTAVAAVVLRGNNITLMDGNARTGISLRAQSFTLRFSALLLIANNYIRLLPFCLLRGTAESGNSDLVKPRGIDIIATATTTTTSEGISLSTPENTVEAVAAALGLSGGGAALTSVPPADQGPSAAQFIVANNVVIGNEYLNRQQLYSPSSPFINDPSYPLFMGIGISCEGLNISNRDTSGGSTLSTYQRLHNNSMVLQGNYVWMNSSRMVQGAGIFSTVRSDGSMINVEGPPVGEGWAIATASSATPSAAAIATATTARQRQGGIFRWLAALLSLTAGAGAVGDTPAAAAALPASVLNAAAPDGPLQTLLSPQPSAASATVAGLRILNNSISLRACAGVGLCPAARIPSATALFLGADVLRVRGATAVVAAFNRLSVYALGDKNSVKAYGLRIERLAGAAWGPGRGRHFLATDAGGVASGVEIRDGSLVLVASNAVAVYALYPFSTMAGITFNAGSTRLSHNASLLFYTNDVLSKCTAFGLDYPLFATNVLGVGLHLPASTITATGTSTVQIIDNLLRVDSPGDLTYGLYWSQMTAFSADGCPTAASVGGSTGPLAIFPLPAPYSAVPFYTSGDRRQFGAVLAGPTAFEAFGSTSSLGTDGGAALISDIGYTGSSVPRSAPLYVAALCSGVYINGNRVYARGTFLSEDQGSAGVAIDGTVTLTSGAAAQLVRNTIIYEDIHDTFSFVSWTTPTALRFAATKSGVRCLLSGTGGTFTLSNNTITLRSTATGASYTQVCASTPASTLGPGTNATISFNRFYEAPLDARMATQNFGVSVGPGGSYLVVECNRLGTTIVETYTNAVFGGSSAISEVRSCFLPAVEETTTPAPPPTTTTATTTTATTTTATTTTEATTTTTTAATTAATTTATTTTATPTTSTPPPTTTTTSTTTPASTGMSGGATAPCTNLTLRNDILFALPLIDGQVAPKLPNDRPPFVLYDTDIRKGLNLTFTVDTETHLVRERSTGTTLRIAKEEKRPDFFNSGSFLSAFIGDVSSASIVPSLEGFSGPVVPLPRVRVFVTRKTLLVPPLEQEIGIDSFTGQPIVSITRARTDFTVVMDPAPLYRLYADEQFNIKFLYASALIHYEEPPSPTASASANTHIYPIPASPIYEDADLKAALAASAGFLPGVCDLVKATQASLIGFRVVPDLRLESVVNTKNGATAVSSVVGGLAAIAMYASLVADIQAASLLGFMNCADPYTHQSLHAFRILSPFATDNSYMGVIVGNLIVTAGLLLLQLASLGVLRLLRRTRRVQELQASIFFPSITLSGVFAFYVGSMYSASRLVAPSPTYYRSTEIPSGEIADSMRTIFGPGSSSTETYFPSGRSISVFVVLMIFAAVLPTVVYIYTVRRLTRAFQRYAFDDWAMQPENRNSPWTTVFALYWVAPEGAIFSEEIRRAFSVLIAPYRSPQHFWVTYPAWPGTLFFIVGLWFPQSILQCQVYFGLIAAVYFAMAAVLLVVRPRRGLLDNMLEGASKVAVGAIFVLAMPASIIPSLPNTPFKDSRSNTAASSGGGGSGSTTSSSPPQSGPYTDLPHYDYAAPSAILAFLFLLMALCIVRLLVHLAMMYYDWRLKGAGVRLVPIWVHTPLGAQGVNKDFITNLEDARDIEGTASLSAALDGITAASAAGQQANRPPASIGGVRGARAGHRNIPKHNTSNGSKYDDDDEESGDSGGGGGDSSDVDAILNATQPKRQQQQQRRPPADSDRFLDISDPLLFSPSNKSNNNNKSAPPKAKTDTGRAGAGAGSSAKGGLPLKDDYDAEMHLLSSPNFFSSSSTGGPSTGGNRDNKSGSAGGGKKKEEEEDAGRGGEEEMLEFSTSTSSAASDML